MHSFKKIIKTIIVLAVCVALLVGLDLALYPCTFMRNDIHSVVTEQYDDIILGTSHGMTDIDPAVMEEVTGRTGHNLCVGGEYGIDAYYIAKLDPGEAKTFQDHLRGGSWLFCFRERGRATIICCFTMSSHFPWPKLEYFWNSIAKCNFRTILIPMV